MSLSSLPARRRSASRIASCSRMASPQRSPLAGEIGGIADAADPAGKTGVGRAQGLVARGRDDALVDALVDLEIAVHVAIEVMAVHLVVQPLDLGDFLVRDVLAGKASGEAFQAGHDVEQLLQIALAQAGARVRRGWAGARSVPPQPEP